MGSSKPWWGTQRDSETAQCSPHWAERVGNPCTSSPPGLYLYHALSPRPTDYPSGVQRELIRWMPFYKWDVYFYFHTYMGLKKSGTDSKSLKGKLLLYIQLFSFIFSGQFSSQRVLVSSTNAIQSKHHYPDVWWYRWSHLADPSLPFLPALCSPV